MPRVGTTATFLIVLSFFMLAFMPRDAAAYAQTEIRYEFYHDDAAHTHAGTGYSRFGAITFNVYYKFEAMGGSYLPYVPGPVDHYFHITSQYLDFVGTDFSSDDSGDDIRYYAQVFRIRDQRPLFPVQFSDLNYLLDLYDDGTLDASLDLKYPTQTWTYQWHHPENGQLVTEYGTYTMSAWFDDPYPNAVPIPSAILLLGSGLAGLAGFRRMRKKQPGLA